MTLSIGILGPLVIESSDLSVGPLSSKARALLGFMAAQRGQTASRARLADLFWPHKSSHQARHNLRNCMLQLRRVFGPSGEGYIRADHVNCRMANVVADLDRFEQLARSQQLSELQAAADLYRGRVLADLDVDSEPFEEWVTVERDRTHAIVCEVLHKLTKQRSAAGDHDAAIHAGRRLVSLDPFLEFGQRALIRAYTRAGRRGEALRQYQSCVQILERELRVAPDRETQKLANAILEKSHAEKEESDLLMARIGQHFHPPHHNRPEKLITVSEHQIRRGRP